MSTDKVDTEVPSPVSGVLTSIKVQEDETVEVGAELAEIDQGGEEPARGQDGERASGGWQAEAGAEEDAGGDETGQGEPGQRSPEEREEVAAEAELGESITEGTITRWLKQEGDRVEADEPLFEVSTDKVDTEVPSPVSGILQSIKVQEDETVEVGAELAVISSGGARAGGQAEAKAEPAREVEAQDERAAAGGGEEAGAEQARPAAAVAGDGAKGAVVSPLVRRLAREHDVDLSQVQGSGSGGRVRREDVEAYLEGRGKQPTRPAARAGDGKAAPAKEAKPAAGAPARQATPLHTGIREVVTPATRLRKVIAERMVASLATSAQLTAAVEIDMTGVMRLRERAKDDFKAREGVSLSPLPFSVLAVIQAIRAYPNANSALDEDMNLHVYQDVNLGIAVDTPKGLFVPVVRNADQLNLSGLARAIADVARRTRDGKVSPNELSGSTFTVTNTGSVGTVWDTPIINQPNAAIFATPAIVKRPVVVEDPALGEVIAVRHMMYGILTYDHRVLDGADAARFLQKVKQVLEAGEFARELGLEEDGE